MLRSLALLALLLFLPIDTRAGGGVTPEVVPARIIARLSTSGDSGVARRYLRLNGLNLLDSAIIGPLRIYGIPVPPGNDPAQLCANLLATGLFAYALPDRELQPGGPGQERSEPVAYRRAEHGKSTLQGSFPPDDPLFSQQYALDNSGDGAGMVHGADIDIRDAWSVTEGDSSVVIAVSEEGFDGAHPDLVGEFVKDSAQFAAANNGFWHGTLIAGILAAKKGNGEGIAGIAPGCRLLIVHNDYGTTMLAVLKALEKVLQWNAVVYTNSWGFQQTGLQPLQEAYDVIAGTTRNGRGTVIVFAAGNDGQPWVSYPSWYDRFIAVGATTEGDQRWNLSNFGRELDLCAPGSNIISTAPQGAYTRAWGTSLAAPMVAGVAALIASANPSLTADSIRAILEMTCDKVGGYPFTEIRSHGSWSPYMGYGRINAGRALRMARGIGDTLPRLVWPRGGEIFTPGDTALIRWRSDRPLRVILRSATVGEQVLATSSARGDDSISWTAAAADTLRLVLMDAASGALLDSLERPIILREPAYSVTLDTTAPFLGLDDYRASGALATILRDRSIYPLPFDFVLGGDTTWAWGWMGQALTPYRTAGSQLQPRSAPQLDPHVTTGIDIAGLLLNDVTGVDSVRFGVIGSAPEREAIIEFDGLHLDTLLYTPSQQAPLAGYRRQVRFHESTGAVSFHYNRPLEIRADDASMAERGAMLAALQVNGETIFPFGSIYLRRLPAGSAVITPRRYARPLTPVRSAVISADSRTTYGYDIHHVTYVTNVAEETASLRASSDFGATWWTIAQAPSSDGAFAALIPPRFAGTLLLSLGGSLDLGWRDTLLVTDHGYTIERIDTAIGAIGADPRASRIVFGGDGTAEIPLPFSLDYFGRSCRSITVHRSGRVEPLFDGGATGEYAMIKATPSPAGTDPDSLAPVRLLYTDDGSGSAAVIEWDSLARYLPPPAPAEARAGSFAQLRIWSDGIIECGYGTPTSGTVPYYFFPSIAYGPYVLISPDFTLRPAFTAPLPLPLAGYRYLPHTPLSQVRREPETAQSVLGSHLTVYPNPTTGRMRIVRDSGDGAWDVVVSTPLGTTIARLSGTGRMIETDCGDLPAGLYLIRERGSALTISAIVVR